MQIVGIIPSRLGSSRLPKKALADICGMPMIAHVCKRSSMANKIDDLYVATDSVEIKEVVEAYGFKAIMTSPEHRNGTERLVEAISMLPKDIDVVAQIFGDEALLNPRDVDVSVNTLINNPRADASILTIDYKKKNSPSDFKAVVNLKGELMYMSRNDIPSDARHPFDSFLKLYHLLSFHKRTLLEYGKLERTPLERVEDHEHLRLLENGYIIQTAKVDTLCVSVDTMEDLDYVRERMSKDPLYLSYK